ncbi:hypothetical protein DVH24_022189, partial [Malus domestica]
CLFCLVHLWSLWLTESLLKSHVRIARFFRFSGIDSSSLHVAENGVSVARNNTFTKYIQECVSNFFSLSLHCNPGEKQLQTCSRCTMHLIDVNVNCVVFVPGFMLSAVYFLYIQFSPSVSILEKLSDMECQLESHLKFITEAWL